MGEKRTEAFIVEWDRGDFGEWTATDVCQLNWEDCFVLG